MFDICKAKVKNKEALMAYYIKPLKHNMNNGPNAAAVTLLDNFL